MASKKIEPNGTSMTWGKLWKWVGILYFLSYIGFLIKASAETGGLAFLNVWQVIAVLSLPAMHMVLFAVIILMYLVVKKFKVENSGVFFSIIGCTYVIFIVFRLISGRPL